MKSLEAPVCRFTDLRMALFLVDIGVAHTLSRGWSLLTWSRKTRYWPTHQCSWLTVLRTVSQEPVMFS